MKYLTIARAGRNLRASAGVRVRLEPLVVPHERRLVYNEATVAMARPSALMEAGMPRFLGKKPSPLWWELAALIVLILVVLFVLEITDTAHIFT